MKKLIRIILKVILGIIIVFAVLVVGAFTYVFIQANQLEKRGKEKLTGPAPVLEIDGHSFRDLNKNGVLDLYEDFRVPVDQRVEDILSQMTLEEKAGMMFHPFLYSEGIIGLFIKSKILLKIFLSYSNPLFPFGYGLYYNLESE